MVKGSDDEVKYYGRLKNVTDSSDASGTVTLTRPTLESGDTLYLFNEQYNGDYKTDYASELKAVTIPSEANAYDVTYELTGLTNGDASVFAKKNTDYAATLTVKTGVANAIYEICDDVEVYVGESSAKLTQGENTYSFDSTTGALTIKAAAITDAIKIKADAKAYSVEVTNSDTTNLFNFEAEYGYSTVAARTMSIKNTGNQKLTVSLPDATSDHFTVTYNPESCTELAVNGELTITVQPKDGLAFNASGYSKDLEIGITAGETVDLSQTIEATFEVTKKPLTPSINGGTVSKIYDGTTALPDDHGLTISLEGALSADADGVSAAATYAYADAFVGTGKTINATGITLEGEKAANYAPTTTSTSAAIGAITPASYVLTGIPSSVYIGSTYTADTIKNAVTNAGDVTISGITVYASSDTERTTPLTGEEADKIATFDDATGTITAKAAGQVVVTYNIVGKDMGGSADAEYSGVTDGTVVVKITSRPSTGGGGGYTPPTVSVTVPISGDENTINVDASVKGDKATIDEVDLDHLDTIIGDDVQTGVVAIDFSTLDKELTEVEIPADVVKQIAEAVNNPANDAESLEIVFTDGTSIEFDAVALGEKAAQADGLDITISILPSEKAKANNAQKEAINGRPFYDISVTSGGEYISDMGGHISVHAPYELKDGEKASGIVVYYVDDNGNRERCETSYDSVKKRVTWKLDQHGIYMIDYNKALANNQFTDVSKDAYYFDAVLWALDNGITEGTSATTFSPDASCTRAQMATFLWRAAGSPAPTTTDCPFTDVSEDAYYYTAVLWAVEKGITVGTSVTTFSPDAPCTRGQMATFLWRNAASPAPIGSKTPFTDVPADAYYANAVQWAYEQEITGGTSATTFSPDASCTRAQMVTFLYRYFEN